MKRPTIHDLATAAGVSVATVNRILGGTVSVRPKTVQRVQSAAEEIGFYGIGAIDDRARKISPHYRLGFLLQQSTRDLYQLFGKKIVAACRERRDDVIDPVVDFVDILTPETISDRLIALGEECDAVAVVAADHPIVGQAIHSLREMGKPVVSYITDQSAPERAAYVGTDNWKLGRTAAFLITQTTQGPGRIAVFIGNHRYQCQDVSDASFRSYLREHAPRLTVEESRPTHEESSEAYRMVAELLQATDDLVGILIVGGGITGVLRALREVSPERRSGIKVVCRDIGPETRKGLSEGLITAALCHPLEATSALLVQTMIDVIGPHAPLATLQRSIPFEIVTPENI
ncbi:LacI family DNA-binding transcriptional regulator [Mesorhizobium sp. VK25A]|uniref:LacI family DNA-binding transcriptional regulator n=1 Tax=Mesorhizobium vachelliae TaxID=3072309 RepID=A0ABU5A4Z1_9HYPH|nr:MULTISPECIES: LacI family DNA-binding transcriptional regulator [unclassified Mesorhizobium]MDX8532771.1 LacI family DNA-binding transcriptional regulator [Mesorhizobium sp. VK25D]MDX8544723.1 LacI family DNA-binding transcriptional regulator [Mesorhizobium sp. VK25A]